MKGPRFWAIMILAGLALFALSFALRPLDEDVGRSVAGARGLVLLAGGLAFLGGVSFIAPAVIIGGVALAYFGRWWGAIRVVGVTGVSDLASRTLKLLFGRERPDFALVETGGFSFPSGHATMGAAVAILIVWFAGRYIRGRALVVAALAFGLAWAVAMAASRLVLGVHYLSDVVAGVGVGTSVASGVLLATMIAEPRVRAAREKRVSEPGP